MLKKIILYLIRKKLSLAKYRCFRFMTQKSKTNEYFFGDGALYKIVNEAEKPYVKISNVSLNYLIGGKCAIEECDHICIGNKNKGFTTYTSTEIGE